MTISSALAETGSALLMAVVAAVLLGALGMGLLTLSNTERAIAWNYHAAAECRHAAEAALERALLDVRDAPDRTALLTGAAGSTFVGAGPMPVTPWGATIDLIAMTAEVQAELGNPSAWGANNPQWRLFAWGPLMELSASGSISSPLYLAVWLADDPSETDGDPFSDTNGVVWLAARALGPPSVRHTVTAAVDLSGGLRLLSWRDWRP